MEVRFLSLLLTGLLIVFRLSRFCVFEPIATDINVGSKNQCVVCGGGSRRRRLHSSRVAVVGHSLNGGVPWLRASEQEGTHTNFPYAVETTCRYQILSAHLYFDN